MFLVDYSHTQISLIVYPSTISQQLTHLTLKDVAKNVTNSSCITVPANRLLLTLLTAI